MIVTNTAQSIIYLINKKVRHVKIIFHRNIGLNLSHKIDAMVLIGK